jgi:hypothetical protein
VDESVVEGSFVEDIDPESVCMVHIEDTFDRMLMLRSAYEEAQ